jgi:hypothetical protein
LWEFNQKKKTLVQTNNVGAAIWAANLVKEMQIAAEQQQSGSSDSAKLAPVQTTV